MQWKIASQTVLLWGTIWGQNSLGSGLLNMHDKTLVRRYALGQCLGRGGFSEVWKAVDLLTTKTVAVKIHDAETNPNALRRS